jgi:hypothetical protein
MVFNITSVFNMVNTQYTDLFVQALDYSHVSLLLGIPSWEENTINEVSLQKKMFILVLNTKRGAPKR